jgi:hypothetical protein
MVMRQALRAGRRVVSWAARVGLGLFILCQLLFLVVYNFLDLATATRDNLPGPLEEVVETVAPGWTHKEGSVHEAVEEVFSVAKRYAQATAQPQGWSLFAPDVAEEITFPAVEVRWDDPAKPGRRPAPVMPYAPEVLLSDNEPRDIRRYLRLGHFRLRRYESYVGVVLKPAAGETEDERNARWRDRIRDYMRREWDTVRAYLRWRWQAYVREHPERPEPRQAVLLMRRYHVPAPDQPAPFDWEGPYVEPVARWRPFDQPPEGRHPLEMYNPVTGRYEWVPETGR